MPSESGSTKSSKTRWGFFSSVRLIASFGSAVTIGVKSALESASRMYLSACGSSSTTKMRISSLSFCCVRVARRGDWVVVPVPTSSATGMVKVNRAPWPGPSLSAQMRPPCASTIPLQMAKPRPEPPIRRSPSSSSVRENFLNRCGNCSAEIPVPSSATVTATWRSSRTTVTRMTDDSSECRAALDRRLDRTWTMRDLSAMTGGRSSARSRSRSCLSTAA